MDGEGIDSPVNWLASGAVSTADEKDVVVDRLASRKARPCPLWQPDILKARLTRRSSREWNEIIAKRPPCRSNLYAASNPAHSSFNSSFTKIRRAWNTLVAAWAFGPCSSSRSFCEFFWLNVQNGVKTEKKVTDTLNSRPVLQWTDNRSNKISKLSSGPNGSNGGTVLHHCVCNPPGESLLSIDTEDASELRSTQSI